MQILGSKFWALGGTWRTDGQKWLNSIEKQKRRSNLKERDKQTERPETDRQSQVLTIMTPRLGAEINNISLH